MHVPAIDTRRTYQSQIYSIHPSLILAKQCEQVTRERGQTRGGRTDTKDVLNTVKTGKVVKSKKQRRQASIRKEKQPVQAGEDPSSEVVKSKKRVRQASTHKQKQPSRAHAQVGEDTSSNVVKSKKQAGQASTHKKKKLPLAPVQVGEHTSSEPPSGSQPPPSRLSSSPPPPSGSPLSASRTSALLQPVDRKGPGRLPQPPAFYRRLLNARAPPQ